MKTKAEIISFLDSKVGTTVPDKVNSALSGQCVTLIKSLLEFIGAPNPYAARGNAKDYANSLLNQSIATNGKGSVNVVVNPTMGVVGSNVYGHIWVEIDGQNWESNGAKALIVTKNTRPSIQGRQWVNLDKWITQPKGEDMINADQVKDLYRVLLGREASQAEANQWVGEWDNAFYGIKDSPEGKAYTIKVNQALKGSAQYVKVEELYRKVS